MKKQTSSFVRNKNKESKYVVETGCCASGPRWVEFKNIRSARIQVQDPTMYTEKLDGVNIRNEEHHQLQLEENY